ncbi:MAG: phosphoribosylformylglycinamidine synthase subunit PurL [Euryarchaeota archaeon]|nr:phosphoribosylformylglycinamidine synthase subunit PurL [Euryarchaeota archaeon]
MPETETVDIDRLVVRRKDVDFPLHDIRLKDASDDELLALSKRMGIGLSLDEMKDARKYFEEKKRDPTDVEMEALGQAWSEHCCYKSSKPALTEHIFGIHEEAIACREDAGLIEFDADHYYAVKLESHNHPSAIEPYGGAATGIGGVLRDVVCMGAQPIALVDPLFFGPLELEQKDLPAGTKHPRYLMQGVVSGIRDYGNRVGIPTVAGGITFHRGYTTNCLVNVGCVGIMKKEHIQHSRAKAAGDVYIYLGGRTGRDGIHGVTFASAELTEGSEEGSRSAVQLGDPITKEPVIHACLEAVEKGFLQGMKDFGGGGLSCVAGELAWDAGLGAEVQLDDIPLKEPGLAPWEIWVSESQERMMWVVKPEDVETALQVCRKWDVEAVVCGKVIDEPVLRVYYQEKKVLEFDLRFSTGGPVYNRPIKTDTEPLVWESYETPADLKDILLRLLADPNIASKEWAIHQYDHIVRANTCLWPLQGVQGKEGPGDATVLKPVADRWKGLAVTADINPYYTERDPYWGALAAVDEATRNLAAVGARISSIADCLNFGNPEKPERLGDLYGSVRALGDGARALGVPFSSGNVSLYNESHIASVPPTPSLMTVGIVEDVRNCATTDLKEPGNLIYVVGRTNREFGGSALQRLLGFHGGQVPRTDLEVLKRSAETVVQSVEKRLVQSCHDISDGGLGVAVAEMAIGGDIGATVDVRDIGLGGNLETGGDLRVDQRLFAESNTRWLIEVDIGDKEAVEGLFRTSKVPLTLVGKTGGPDVVFADDGKEVFRLPVAAVRDTWKHAIGRLLGDAHSGGAAQ